MLFELKGSIKEEGSYSKILETGDEFLNLFKNLEERDETVGKLYSRQSSLQVLSFKDWKGPIYQFKYFKSMLLGSRNVL